MATPQWLRKLSTGTPREREWALFCVLGGFGLLVLPLCVFVVGRLTLGAYEGSGLPAFLGTLYLDLVKFNPAAWGLVLGPYLIFQALRLASRPARRLGGQGRRQR